MYANATLYFDFEIQMTIYYFNFRIHSNLNNEKLKHVERFGHHVNSKDNDVVNGSHLGGG